MRGTLDWLIKHPRVMDIFVVIIILAGIYSIFKTPVELFPNLNIPIVNVITHYPGASPEDMEILITRPVENELRGIHGVKRVFSISSQGISKVTVEFSPETTVSEARQLVLARLSFLSGILPQGAIPRLENIGTTLQEVVGYVIYGGESLINLRKMVKYELSNQIMGIQGVSFVEILGGDRRAYTIHISPEEMLRFNFGISSLKKSIRESNVTKAEGYISRGAREYPLRGDSRLMSINDILSIPIKTGEGEVLLGSIARVSEEKVKRHYEIMGDSFPAVAFIVRKQPGASTISVVKGVEEVVKRFRKQVPSGVRIRKFYDQSEIIEEARNTILNDLLVGAILAILVLFIFTGDTKLTLIVGGTIPLTLLTTLALMESFGVGLNVITFSALALAVGMIVDDAIVVTENIFRHIQKGEKGKEASLEGTLEIAGPDASGTFTTVFAFLPLTFVGGIIGLFLRPFGFTISIALLTSLILSLSLVPVLLRRGKSKAGKAPGQKFLSGFSEWVDKALGYSFTHPWKIIGISLLAFFIAGLSAIFIRSVGLLPPIDEGSILVEYIMPPGTSLKESNRIGNELDRIAMADPDVSCVYRRTGSPQIGYQIEGVNRGEIVMKLKPKKERRRNVNKIMDSIRKKYSQFKGVAFLYHQPTQEKMDESLSGVSSFFAVRVYGEKLSTLTDIAGKVEKIMEREGSITNIFNPSRAKVSEIVVKINHSSLSQYGVDLNELFSTLRAAFWGLEVTRILRQKEEISVLIDLDYGTKSIDNLKMLPIRTTRGGIIPLGRLAEIKMNSFPSQLTRINGEREITILGEVEGNVLSVANHLEKSFARLHLPAGYRVEVAGQYRNVIRGALELIFVAFAAILLIYLILSLEFHSWIQPLIIMITTPFSIVGAILTLFITGQGLDISVAMGVITLLGISVNNAIVLLDFANRRINSGILTAQALREAVSVRLRPILMTSSTTIFALIPVAIGLGVGSKTFQPFSITVIGGLITATLSTLIIVPTVSFLLSNRH